MDPTTTPSRKSVSITAAKTAPGSGMLDVEEVQDLFPERSLFITRLVTEEKENITVQLLTVLELLTLEIEL